MTTNPLILIRNSLKPGSATLRSLSQLLRYCSVGAANTLVSLITSFALLSAGFNIFASNLTGYAVAIANSFVMNRKWTFSHSGRIKDSLPRFLLVCGVCYIVQLITLAVMIKWLSLNAYIGQVYAMAIYTLLSFVANKRIAFVNPRY